MLRDDGYTTSSAIVVRRSNHTERHASGCSGGTCTRALDLQDESVHVHGGSQVAALTGVSIFSPSSQ
jgi:hypothetical protein